MPPFGPISRRKLVGALRKSGFAGPFTGSDHEIMVRDEVRIRIPNPHRAEIGRNLVAEILTQAGISRNEWESI